MILWLQTMMGNLDESEIHARKLNAKERSTSSKGDISIFPSEEITKSENLPEAGSIRNGSGSLRRTSKELGEVSTSRNTCRR